MREAKAKQVRDDAQSQGQAYSHLYSLTRSVSPTNILVMALIMALGLVVIFVCVVWVFDTSLSGGSGAGESGQGESGKARIRSTG